MRNKIATAVITVILTTAASTFISNLINDSRTLILEKIENVNQKVVRLETNAHETQVSLDKLTERVYELKSDLRSVDSKLVFNRSRMTEFNEEFEVRMAMVERQVTEIRKKVRIY